MGSMQIERTATLLAKEVARRFTMEIASRIEISGAIHRDEIRAAEAYRARIAAEALAVEVAAMAGLDSIAKNDFVKAVGAQAAAYI